MGSKTVQMHLLLDVHRYQTIKCNAFEDHFNIFFNQHVWGMYKGIQVEYGY